MQMDFALLRRRLENVLQLCSCWQGLLDRSLRLHTAQSEVQSLASEDSRAKVTDESSLANLGGPWLPQVSSSTLDHHHRLERGLCEQASAASHSATLDDVALLSTSRVSIDVDDYEDAAVVEQDTADGTSFLTEKKSKCGPWEGFNRGDGASSGGHDIAEEILMQGQDVADEAPGALLWLDDPVWLELDGLPRETCSQDASHTSIRPRLPLMSCTDQYTLLEHAEPRTSASCNCCGLKQKPSNSPPARKVSVRV